MYGSLWISYSAKKISFEKKYPLKFAKFITNNKKRSDFYMNIEAYAPGFLIITEGLCTIPFSKYTISRETLSCYKLIRVVSLNCVNNVSLMRMYIYCIRRDECLMHFFLNNIIRMNYFYISFKIPIGENS